VTPLRTVLLVAEREVRQRLRSRLFVGTTIALSVLLAVLGALPLVLDAFGDDDTDDVAGESLALAVAGELSTAEQVAVASVIGPAELLTLPDVEEVAAAVTDGRARVGIVPGDRVVVRASGTLFDADAGLAAQLAEVLGTAAALDELGVSDQADAVLAAERLEVDTLGGDEGDAAGRYLVANIGVVFLFGILIFYSSMIVNGVIEEKGSRVIELLVEAIPIPQLLTGKLLGLGAIGLGQALVLFVPATAVLVLTGGDLLPPGLGAASGLIIGWFILGYALYSVVSAGLGALVSRPEEAQAVLTPASMLMVAGYFVSFVALQAPDSTVSRVTSLVPFTSPYVMLVRQIVSDPPLVEVVLAVVLLLVTIVLATAAAARIYAGGILRIGARVKLGDAWRGASV
jgi:ABC-2 type transport system permease protein